MTTIDVAPEDNPTSQPQPDLIVLAKESREFRKENPQPAGLRLFVEISDSTLGFDLTVKASLYARAGILESYQSVTVYNDQESVSPLAAPEHQFRVADAFPD